MQLRTLIGYRAVHCRKCGKQELSPRNKCQCNILWHQCQMHRIDPKEHKSRKAAKLTNEQKLARRDEEIKREQEKTKRRKKAPEIEEEKIDGQSTIAQKVSKGVEFKRRQSISDTKLSPHNVTMLERIKKRKESEPAETAHEPRADTKGQPKQRKGNEVVESGPSSSADRVGQPKQQISTRRKHEDLMRELVQKQQDQQTKTTLRKQ